jgi:hypothetical protein
MISSLCKDFHNSVFNALLLFVLWRWGWAFFEVIADFFAVGAGIKKRDLYFICCFFISLSFNTIIAY